MRPTRLLIVAILAALASIPARSGAIHTLPLERLPPRPHRNGSRHGFPTTLTLHDRPHWLARTLLGSRTTTRAVTADLHGGITAVGEYYLRVKLGGQPARVQVDTGSATFAVPMAGCDSCRSGDLRFDPKKSNSGAFERVSCDAPSCGSQTCGGRSACGACSKDRNACCAKESVDACAFELKYGDGSGARGALITEMLEIAPGAAAEVTVGGILHDSSDFERPSVDGIFGFAFKQLACTPTCVEPPFDVMVSKGVVKNDLFAICMTPEGGALALGEYDGSMGKSEPQWVDLKSKSYYGVDLDGKIRVAGKEVELPSFSYGIVDSGTTLMVITKKAFKALLDYLQEHHCDVPDLCNAKTWFQPAVCVSITDSELATMPTLSIMLGSVALDLEPQDYMVPYHDDGKVYRCVGFMTEDPIGSVEVILGNTLMLKYNTIYDRQNSRIGFAERAGDCSGRGKGETHDGPGTDALPSGATVCADRDSCSECASESSCVYNHHTKLCSDRAGHPFLTVYPFCGGKACLCPVEGWVSPVFLVVGGLLASFVAFITLAVIVRWARNRRYRAVYAPRNEHDFFDDEEEDFN